MPARLTAAGSVAHGVLTEGNSWRADAFRRYKVGVFTDGEDEWLDCWRSNHLLAPFAGLFPRRTVGVYGGRPLPFLGLADLIRSKETEQTKNWLDIDYLQEALDETTLSAVRAGTVTAVDGLSRLRSRRGYDSAVATGLLVSTADVRQALSRATNPITQAYLLPHAPDAPVAPASVPIEPMPLDRLRQSVPGSRLQPGLIELVRRRDRAAREDQDKADKQAALAAATPPAAPPRTR